MTIKYKFFLLGDSGVGKSLLLKCFCYENYKFTSTHLPTTGCGCTLKKKKGLFEEIKMIFYDNNGNERFRTISFFYIKDMNGIRNEWNNINV